jgi:hypothetical protein
MPIVKYKKETPDFSGDFKLLGGGIQRLSKRVLYRHELPESTLSPMEDLEQVENYLKSLFVKLEDIESRGPWLLPSIAEIAQTIQAPKQLLWEGLRELKSRDGFDIEFQTGYYGQMSLNHR